VSWVTAEGGNEVEITPEPTPEEREAILAALEQLRELQADAPRRWWEEGLRENLEEDEER